MNEEDDIYKELTEQKPPEFFCEVCNHYPIIPVHGHFMCPECLSVTKCCEGLPAE